MNTDEVLIEKVKKLFEASTGWGDSGDWNNKDFIVLSVKIHEKTGASLSHVTLKRIWGKVKYTSLPNIYTLDTLVQYLGFEDWRAFKSNQPDPLPGSMRRPETKIAAYAVLLKLRLFFLLGLGVLVLTLLATKFHPYTSKVNKRMIDASGYHFSSRKIVTEGVPNSVVFNYDASAAPEDSVIIQQSWDKNLRARVSKNQHQHTSIYYYPDFYAAKLIVKNKIVKTHHLLIKSKGWLAMVANLPVPMYFDSKEAIHNGSLSLTKSQIESKNIKMQPSPPTVLFSNVTDFGEIYSDDFIFETSIRNDYSAGSAICQQSRVYLLCEGTAIWIPLCAKGCVSDLDLLFTDYYASGKENDLSCFGVDFEKFVNLRIESKQGQAKIYINNSLCYQVKSGIIRSKIIGFDITFKGTGAVDFVRLKNSLVNYSENF